MSQTMKFAWAMGAAIVGTLCFVAKQPRFGLLSESTGQFVGIVFFLLSGLLWAAYGFGASKKE